MDQLNLMFHMDEESFRRRLEAATRKEISLVITDNSSSMLSMRRKGNTVYIRAHRIFLSAGSEVLDEIGSFIRNSRTKTPQIRHFIKQNFNQLRKRPPRKVSIKTDGNRYDLQKIFQSINTKYFEGRVASLITWGLKGPRRVAARRTLGSYCGDNNMIRINPMLDNKRIPRYFLEFIVYHEMLHADLGIKTDGARRLMHSAEFRRREKMFEHYDRAIAWEKKKW
ncbi:MAG: SprT-like domain-containing protein [Nitrospirota bacterium]